MPTVSTRASLSCALALLLALGVSAVACDEASLGSISGTGGSPTGAAATGSASSSTGSTGSSGGTGGGAPVLVPPFLGANVEPSGVVFRVWAPHATGAKVRGQVAPADVPMSAIDGGVFEAHVAGAMAGQEYSFVLETPSGELVRVDPYCRELTASSCRVVDPAAYPWQTGAFKSPPREQAVVYEMHVGSFAVPSGASFGTYASARDALPGLADLGVDVIELMPVQSSGSGPTQWGYNPQLYFAPKPSLGSLDDLRSFVDAAHGLGMAVWIDTVVNHMDGWAEAPLACFDGDCPSGSSGIYYFAPGPYANTPWGPRPDYTSKRVSDMLVDSVDTWMTELRCDGFRVDSVSNIRALDGNGTTPGGRELLLAVNDRVHAHGGLSVAEDLKGYSKITDAEPNGGFGFDAQWDGFGWSVTDTLALASDDARDLGKIQGALEGSYDGDRFARLLFTENHDTVGNGGSRLPNRIDPANPTSWSARKRSMLGAALLLTTPGVPMLFQGQESLALGTFESHAKPLPAPTTEGLAIRSFYRDLIRLRRNRDGGSGGLADSNIEVFHRNDPAKVIAYRRFGASGEDVVVIVNLKNKAYTQYDIGVDAPGPWTVRLDTDSQSYGADFAGGQTGSITATPAAKDGKPYKLPLRLGAYSAMVLTR